MCYQLPPGRASAVSRVRAAKQSKRHKKPRDVGTTSFDMTHHHFSTPASAARRTPPPRSLPVRLLVFLLYKLSSSLFSPALSSCLPLPLCGKCEPCFDSNDGQTCQWVYSGSGWCPSGREPCFGSHGSRLEIPVPYICERSFNSNCAGHSHGIR